MRDATDGETKREGEGTKQQCVGEIGRQDGLMVAQLAW